MRKLLLKRQNVSERILNGYRTYGLVSQKQIRSWIATNGNRISAWAFVNTHGIIRPISFSHVSPVSRASVCVFDDLFSLLCPRKISEDQTADLVEFRAEAQERKHKMTGRTNLHIANVKYRETEPL